MHCSQLNLKTISQNGCWNKTGQMDCDWIRLLICEQAMLINQQHLSV